MSEHILVEREGGLLTLRLNRADKKNALTRAMYSQMAEVLDAANADRSVRVVLITGGPECFTSGNDVADFLQAPPTGMDSPVFQFMRALFDFEKPVVAAVAGPAANTRAIRWASEAPNTTPPPSSTYSAMAVNAPPEVESFRTASSRFQAAKAAGR